MLLIIAGVMIISSCAVPVIPADQIQGNYTGQYAYNASITNAVTAAVTKVNNNTCNIQFSGSGISPLTISNISITANSDNTNFALSKTGGMGESMSGAVQNGELSVSYGFIGGAMTFVGTK